MLIKKLHPHLFHHCVSAKPTPPLLPSDYSASTSPLNLSKTIIIRHANSTFNHRWHEVEKDIAAGTSTSDAFLDVVKDTSLLDCPLSELGVRQCSEAQTLANSL
jgi:hypothetical protein